MGLRKKMGVGGSVWRLSLRVSSALDTMGTVKEWLPAVRFTSFTVPIVPKALLIG